MSRRYENAVLLTGSDCALLYQTARLRELRLAARGSHERLYQLLTDITEAAFVSVEGKPATETTESDDSGNTGILTVAEVARRAGITPRTVRNHIDAGLLEASQQGRFWVISAQAAEQYIAGRQAA